MLILLIYFIKLNKKFSFYSNIMFWFNEIISFTCKPLLLILLNLYVYVFIFFTYFDLLILNLICLTLLCIFNQFIGIQGLIYLTMFFLSLFFFKNFLIFYNMVFYNYFDKPHFIFLGDYSLITLDFKQSMVFFINGHNMCFILLTNSIGLLAVYYSFIYMRFEPYLLKFILLIYAFLLSMVFFLSSFSLTTLLLGWELIGIFSFMLINFWVNKVSTLKSAFKALFFNKLSDAALIIVLILYISSCPNNVLFFFSYLLSISFKCFSFLNLTIGLHFLFMFFITIASFCKSAQLGFHIWLPDSMEAPVPASALIHSATLVSAGIYLISNLPAFLIPFNYWYFLLIYGSITSFYGALVACAQSDLKKILAYSTISHCGLLFSILSLNNMLYLYLYLYLHGFYKSISFMMAGNIISYNNGYQDYRRMGYILPNNTLECNLFIFSMVNLSGLPFTFGFFSKFFYIYDLNNLFFLWSNIFIYSSAFISIFYTLNTVKYTFFTPKKSTLNLYMYANLNLYTKKVNNFYFRFNGGNTFFFIITFITILFLSITSYSLFFLLMCEGFNLNLFTSLKALDPLFFKTIYILLLLLFFFKEQSINIYAYILLIQLIYTI